MHKGWGCGRQSCTHMPVEAGGGAPAGRGPVGGVQAAEDERRAGHERRQRPLGLRVHPEQAVAVGLRQRAQAQSAHILQRRRSGQRTHQSRQPESASEADKPGQSVDNQQRMTCGSGKGLTSCGVMADCSRHTVVAGALSHSICAKRTVLQKGSGVRSGALPGTRSGAPPAAAGAGSTAAGVTVGSAESACDAWIQQSWEIVAM